MAMAVRRARTKPAKAKKPAKPKKSAAKAKAKQPANNDARSEQEKALLAAIAANVRDDEPRHVYADLLLERGDPRGTIIQLQLSGAKPSKVQMLIAQHMETWLGDLVEIVHPHHCEVVRGFPFDVTLQSLAGVDAVNAHAGHPFFATVERLGLDGMDLPEEFLRHDGLRNVVELRDLESEPFRALLEWDSVPYSTLGLVFTPTAADVKRLLGARAKLAALRNLALDTHGMAPRDQYAWLWDSWLAEQLDELRVTVAPEALGSWLAAFGKSAFRCMCVKTSIVHQTTTLVVEHDRDKLVITARTSQPEDLSKVLAKLEPGAFARLRTARPQARHAKVLENHAKRIGFALELTDASNRHTMR